MGDSPDSALVLDLLSFILHFNVRELPKENIDKMTKWVKYNAIRSKGEKEEEKESFELYYVDAMLIYQAEKK